MRYNCRNLENRHQNVRCIWIRRRSLMQTFSRSAGSHCRSRAYSCLPSDWYTYLLFLPLCWQNSVGKLISFFFFMVCFSVPLSPVTARNHCHFSDVFFLFCQRYYSVLITHFRTRLSLYTTVHRTSTKRRDRIVSRVCGNPLHRFWRIWGSVQILLLCPSTNRIVPLFLDALVLPSHDWLVCSPIQRICFWWKYSSRRRASCTQTSSPQMHGLLDSIHIMSNTYPKLGGLGQPVATCLTDCGQARQTLAFTQIFKDALRPLTL